MKRAQKNQHSKDVPFQYTKPQYSLTISLKDFNACHAGEEFSQGILPKDAIHCCSNSRMKTQLGQTAAVLSCCAFYYV